MITVISGTNRKDSRTLIIAKAFVEYARATGSEVQLLDLASLDLNVFSADMYAAKGISPELAALQEKYILGAEKLAFILPEYNGSYPGVLKFFIDAISVNEYARNFKGKVISLTGVASGRAGNLRGMDHLSASLSYMGGWILPNKLPVSSVDGLLDDNNQLTDEGTINALKTQAEQLIAA
ncbi:MAG: NAD(P)H-dependent oxidoreductase [Bacteroidota bacterium]